MTDSSELSKILSPLLAEFQPKSLLLVGETVISCIKVEHDTRSQQLKAPYSPEQLTNLASADLAIISEISEKLSKQGAIEWISLIRNYHAPHIIFITEPSASSKQNWQLADYLALGFNLVDSTEHYQVFTYAIESYRPKRDWLNSRFWANPENYNKFRW